MSPIFGTRLALSGSSSSSHGDDLSTMGLACMSSRVENTRHTKTVRGAGVHCCYGQSSRCATTSTAAVFTLNTPWIATKYHVVECLSMSQLIMDAYYAIYTVELMHRVLHESLEPGTEKEGEGPSPQVALSINSEASSVGTLPSVPSRPLPVMVSNESNGAVVMKFTAM